MVKISFFLNENKMFCFYLFIELNDFKTRRVQMFRKNLIELTELQIKHAKVNYKLIKHYLLSI
jgi:hypothetical protein